MKSWKSSLFGAIMATLGIIAASGKPSIKAAVTDPTVQVLILAGALGAVSKDNNVSTATTASVQQNDKDIAAGK